MPPIPKIKKFSRSKITEQEPNEEFNEEYNEPIQPIVKVKKPRNKKVKAPIYEYGGEEPPEHQEPEPIIEDDFELPDVGPLEFDTDFLRELNNENYEKEDTVKETIQQPLTQSEQIINQLIRGKNTGKKQPKKQKEIKSLFEDDDSLFDEIGTECLGREKREMIAKINQYKNLFPDELKKFKIKKGANTQELKVYLEEMETIVDCSSVENFLTDSVLQCIRMVEGVSSYSSKYNIQGCADLLKSNKQFHSLCKQLYIKYKVFSAVPAEYQLIMLVATTAYIAKAKNSNRGNIEAFLNQPVNN